MRQARRRAAESRPDDSNPAVTLQPREAIRPPWRQSGGLDSGCVGLGMEFAAWTGRLQGDPLRGEDHPLGLLGMSTCAPPSMLAHPLRRKLSALRRGARRLIVARGLGWLAAVVVSLLVVLGLIDYFVRIRDPGLRWMASAAFYATAAWVVWRRLLDPLTVSWRDTELALRVERRFPRLGDRLASAVDFLQQAEDDPLAGSAALRRAAIARATTETEALDFAEALDARPAVRSLGAGVVAVLLAAILATADPAAARTAVARVFNPTSRAAWPRQTHWRLVHPVERIARGRPFEIEVIDAGGARLPDEARIYYRFENPDATATIESESMRRLGDRFVARRESVTRSFAFRVEGGDDSSMPWQAVEVVDPPSVCEPVIELTPPAYTGWPSEKAEGNLRALVGTKLRLRARADKPLARALLRFDDGGSIGAALDGDGQGILAPAPGQPAWVVDRSRKWWFELVDRKGIAGGGDARWEIAAVPDQPPSVAIERPSANVYVTPEAVVPLRIAAKDDLVIRRVALVCRREVHSDATGPSGEPRTARAAATSGAATRAAEANTAGAETSAGAQLDDRPADPSDLVIVLFDGADSPPASSSALVSEILSGGLQWADRRTIDHRWDLQTLGLPPGEQLVFRAEATDYLGQSHSSEARRLIVITPEQLQQRIAARQSAILAELQRLRDVQAQGRAGVEAVRLRWSQRVPMEQADVDRIEGAELAQRQVARGLTHRGEGVAMHVVGLLEDLENNRLGRGNLDRRLRALLDELDRLDREHLTPALRALNAASKDAQVRLARPPEPVPGDSLTAAALEEAEGHQVHAIETLGALIARLAEWDNYHRFHREIGRLLQDHQDVARRSADMARRTLSRELGDLAPGDLADLRVVAAAQSEVGRRLEVIQQEMGVMREQLQETDPLAADALADALDEARRTAVGARVRAAADHLRSNRIAQAVADQKEVADDLQSLLDLLAGRHERELDRLVAKLREAERELAETQSRQAELRRAFEAAGANAESEHAAKQLASRQETLRRESQRLARRLERLAAERAAAATRQASDRMGEAGAGAAGGDSSRAASEAAAAEDALAEARRELATRRAQAEAELALEQLARLEDAVKHLRRQQDQALEETRRLEAIRTSEGRLSRSQLLSVADLARLQRSLEDDAGRLADELEGTGVFRMAIGSAADAMGAAAGLLERQQTDQQTQDLEQRAIRRLDLILDALAPESVRNDPDASGAGDQGDQPAGAPGEGVASLAELKLVRSLQQEVHQETARLDHDVAAGGGRPTTDQQQAYVRLAEQQARLAELLLDLVAPPGRAAEQGDEHRGQESDLPERPTGATAPDGDSRHTEPKENEP